MSPLARLVTVVLYIAMLAGVTWAMFYVRDDVTPQFATRKGQADWQAWRHDAAEEAAGKGPVTRPQPKSVEPPLVILMRDYFAVCLGGAILFSSLLFAVVAFVVRGITAPRRSGANDQFSSVNSQ